MAAPSRRKNAVLRPVQVHVPGAAVARPGPADASDGGGQHARGGHDVGTGQVNFISMVELINVVNDRGEAFRLERKTWEHYVMLKECLASDENIKVDLDSAYRDEADQQRIWDEFTAEFGIEYTRKFCLLSFSHLSLSWSHSRGWLFPALLKAKTPVLRFLPDSPEVSWF